MMDWEAKHKELCREDVEERKIKGDSKERTKSKAENLKKEDAFLKSHGLGLGEVLQACQRGEREEKGKRGEKEKKAKGAKNGKKSVPGKGNPKKDKVSEVD